MFIIVNHNIHILCDYALKYAKALCTIGCMAPHFGVQIRSYTPIKYLNIIMVVMIIITVIVILGEVVHAYFAVALGLKKVMS